MKYLILSAEEALERNHKEALKRMVIQPPQNFGDPSYWWSAVNLIDGDVALVVVPDQRTRVERKAMAETDWWNSLSPIEQVNFQNANPERFDELNILTQAGYDAILSAQPDREQAIVDQMKESGTLDADEISAIVDDITDLLPEVENV